MLEVAKEDLIIEEQKHSEIIHQKESEIQKNAISM